MKTVTSSAPGKLMLLGEHAVVYGYPCLVAAVNKGITVKISNSPDKQVIPDSVYVKAAVRKFFAKYQVKSSISISTTSDILPTWGLGSSAAVTVAALNALSKFFAISLSAPQLFDLAFSVVRSIHRKSSGFDVAAAVYGGTIYYQKDKFIKKLPAKNMPLLTVYSGIKADTAKMVEKVAELRKNHSQKVESVFFQIGKLVNKGKLAYQKSDWDALGNLFNLSQEKLVELGVSTPIIDKLIDSARQNSALGAKLSGAGGGDCIIMLYKPAKKQILIDAIKANAGQILDVL